MQNSSYKKILVPVDGSKYSNRALAHACNLAKKYDSRISLIYVIDNSRVILFVSRKDYLNELKNFGKKVLEKATRMTEKRKVKSKQVMKEGKPAQQILNFVKKEKHDLIVVGNKGLGSIDRFFMGSVSTKLVNNSVSCISSKVTEFSYLISVVKKG